MRNLLLLTHQFVYSRLAVRCKVYLPIAMLFISISSSTAQAQNCPCGRATLLRLGGINFWGGNSLTLWNADSNGCLPCPTTTTTTVTTTSSTTSTTVTTTTAPTVTLPRQPIQLPYGRCRCTCEPTTCTGTPVVTTTTIPTNVTTTTLTVSRIVVCPPVLLRLSGIDFWNRALSESEQTYNSRYGVGNWIYGTRPNCVS